MFVHAKKRKKVIENFRKISSSCVAKFFMRKITFDSSSSEILFSVRPYFLSRLITLFRVLSREECQSHPLLSRRSKRERKSTTGRWEFDFPVRFSSGMIEGWVADPITGLSTGSDEHPCGLSLTRNEDEMRFSRLLMGARGVVRRINIEMNWFPSHYLSCFWCHCLLQIGSRFTPQT